MLEVDETLRDVFGFGSTLFLKVNLVLQLPRMTQIDSKSFFELSPDSMNREKKLDTTLIDTVGTGERQGIRESNNDSP